MVTIARPGDSAASGILAIKVTDTFVPSRDDVDQITFVCTP
jgi:hypothetical protein